MLYDQIQEAIQFIRQKSDVQPSVTLVLGSGLSSMADAIEISCSIPYSEIPHFPTSTVLGHPGQLLLGHLEGHPVVVMMGRFHFYEGYTLQQVTFPVRVMKYLGSNLLILSNAAGSVNPTHETGDLVFLRDHINLLPDNPLRGPNDERLGPRFPDMLHTYDVFFINRAMQIAKENGIRAHSGVYACLSGPNFETPAEYSWLHHIGADLAGMSTVPEAIVGKHMNMKIFATSVVTDLGYPPARIHETTHEEVVKIARKASAHFEKVVRKLLRENVLT